MAQASCGCSTPAAPPPHPWLRILRRPTRDEIEATLEAWILFLEALDGDADAEPEEPDQSAMEWAGGGAQRFNVGLAA